PTMQSGLRKRKVNEPMSTLFENFPIVVELNAEVDMFLPFFGTMTVSGTAIGYREVVNRSKVGQLPDQMACPSTAADCPCGSANETMDANCECQLKTNLCTPLSGQGIDKYAFNKNTCSCE